MKKILYIFLTLSIISTGCSKEEDNIQPTQTQISTTNLDSDLYGVWDRGSYALTLSSNGQFVLYSNYSNDGSSGNWWVEGNNLLLQYNTGGGLGDNYSVNGNELSYLGFIWYR